MGKANEQALNNLHGLVTEELAARVRLKGECSTADLKAAIDWLAKNNITGVATKGSPLHSLVEGLTEADRQFVEGLVS